MHYYSFHIGDYMSHTRHLSLMEDLAFRRLLDFYYLHEQPIKQRDIARQIGMREHEQDVLTVLNEFFVSTEDGFVSPRADKEITEFKNHQAKSAWGAFVRDNKKIAEKADKEVFIAKFFAGEHREYIETLIADHLDMMGTSAPHDATNTQEPITNNHKPITINQDYSVAKATGDKSPLTPDEIIFGYGIPLLTNAGTADKQARSFLGGLRKSHGDDAVIDALRDCIRAKPLQPLEWLAKVLPPGGRQKLNKQEALEASNRAVVERLLRKEGLA